MNDEEPTPTALFVADAPKRAKLKTLIDDPLFKEAVALVDNQMRPRVGTASDTKPELATARFHQCAGAAEFQTRLRQLTKAPVDRKPLTGKALAKSAEDLPKTDS